MPVADWPFDPLIPLKYGAILADPPWAYAMRSEKGYAKSPEAHYSTMPLDAIKALPVRNLAGPDCLLFMWSKPMARFTYHGPVQSISLAVGRAKDKDGNEASKFKDVDLHPGKETPDLRDDNPIVAALIARKLLQPVETKKPAKSDTDTKGEK